MSCRERQAKIPEKKLLEDYTNKLSEQNGSLTGVSSSNSQPERN
jgi:hypothetical protein